jgi:hypothetical protein
VPNMAGRDGIKQVARMQRSGIRGFSLRDAIPVRLARYGLMQPSTFIGEMRERMESATVE